MSVTLGVQGHQLILCHFGVFSSCDLNRIPQQKRDCVSTDIQSSTQAIES
uniref:Uncharacterized protein n=1 Tax=Anguilla anguilla TaxID=7936 RepID=A0A0E9QTE6_ANGAN